MQSEKPQVDVDTLPESPGGHSSLQLAQVKVHPGSNITFGGSGVNLV